jgi:vanillate O-demethylase ferredoxin subunit
MSTKTFSVRVNRIRREAIDIASYELVEPNGQPLPAFTPGSHIDVHLGPNLIRQYSLCNGPDDLGHYVIAVKREPESRGGSAAMHERVKEGDLLTISEPRNNFPLEPDAEHHTLLAGGIGVTPILSMARHLCAAGASFELHYFTRSLQHTAFHDVLSGPEYKGKGKVDFHYAIEPAALRPYLRRLLWRRPPGAHLYLCGPKPFMDMIEEVAAPTWPPETVHLEYFTADPRALTGPQDAFEVRLAMSGGTYTVPEGKSIVEVLAEHGIHVEVSCEQGVCGTCLTGVLEGVPDHRDMFLTDEEHQEGDKMTVCVSRAKSPVLVLDL